MRLLKSDWSLQQHYPIAHPPSKVYAALKHMHSQPAKVDDTNKKGVSTPLHIFAYTTIELSSLQLKACMLVINYFLRVWLMAIDIHCRMGIYRKRANIVPGSFSLPIDSLSHFFFDDQMDKRRDYGWCISIFQTTYIMFNIVSKRNACTRNMKRYQVIKTEANIS